MEVEFRRFGGCISSLTKVGPVPYLTWFERLIAARAGVLIIGRFCCSLISCALSLEFFDYFMMMIPGIQPLLLVGLALSCVLNCTRGELVDPSSSITSPISSPTPAPAKVSNLFGSPQLSISTAAAKSSKKAWEPKSSKKSKLSKRTGNKAPQTAKPTLKPTPSPTPVSENYFVTTWVVRLQTDLMRNLCHYSTRHLLHSDLLLHVGLKIGTLIVPV
jgi:hypothetical protein